MNIDGTLAVQPWDPLGRCTLCHRILSSEIETSGDHESMSICGDCKFLFLEDNGGNLESTENMFPDMINLVLGDNDVFSHAARFVNSDTDIDPIMHAGLNHWEESESESESESDENTVGSFVGPVRLHRSLATNGRNLPVDWLSGIVSPEDQETSGYVVNARGFEERLAAPPAAASFVKNLEQVVVNEEGLVCVICKDGVCVGGVVNRLPCLHVYHCWCIESWLKVGNTCPLCRYELPTDDKDCVNRSVGFQGNEEGVGGGRRWWFVAGMVGVGIVVWWFGGGVFGGF